MPLDSGTRLGPYQIVGPLGAGGMGEVYRARDGRLDRVVAIKLVPDAFAGDPERLARFEREARLLASLNHPNIAVIHGLEADAGRRFIVMECVEGVSLAQRLAAGPLPVEEAIDVGRQVATALEAAHEGGVVHRDLKPGNVMITPAGVAKVLDFGLAKGAAGSASDTSLSASPTMTYAATGAGVILGTAAYMSPEQARGKPVDRRTDIWAFGCVLFECLTGRQAFEGETVSDLIASILKGGIEWDSLPSDTPPRVRELLHRCLERDPRQRLRDIGEARLTLEQPMAGHAPAAAPPTAAARGGLPAPLAIGAAIALAALAGLGGWALKPTPQPPTTWAHLAPPEGLRFHQLFGGHMALSGDGRWLATVAVDTGGTRRILVRDFETGGTRLLTGSEEAIYPFWSPDARSLCAFKEGKLIRFDLDGGAVTVLAPATDGRGGTWSRDDVIVFAPAATGGLSALSASGGEVRVLVPDSLGLAYRFPHFLPDGRRFVCAYFESSGTVAMEVRALDGGKPRRLPLGSNISGNAYYAGGRLFYWQERALRARPFDLGRLAFTADAATVASQVAASPPRARADIAVAASGAILYRQSLGGGGDLVVVRERGGRVLSRIEFSDALEDLALSPDGRRLALSVRPLAGGGDVDVWTYDLERSGAVRLTFSGQDDDPIWSPDGQRLAWQGQPGIRVKSSSGAGHETTAYQTPMDVVPSQWTSDGKTLLFSAAARQSAGGLDAIWTLALGDTAARQLLANPTSLVRYGQVSPDRRWIAYASTESRRFEIYVQDYPGLRGRWQVSTRGGLMPRWRRDGRELFFFDYDGRALAARVEVRDSSLAVGNPEVLFETQMGPHVSNRSFSWDVDAAGSRFYCLEPRQRQDERQAMVVIRNWRPTGAAP